MATQTTDRQRIRWEGEREDALQADYKRQERDLLYPPIHHTKKDGLQRQHGVTDSFLYKNKRNPSSL